MSSLECEQMTFKQRCFRMLQAIKSYSLVRYDVLLGENDALIAAPKRYLALKIANFYVNRSKSYRPSRLDTTAPIPNPAGGAEDFSDPVLPSSAAGDKRTADVAGLGENGTSGKKTRSGAKGLKSGSKSTRGRRAAVTKPDDNSTIKDVKVPRLEATGPSSNFPTNANPYMMSSVDTWRNIAIDPRLSQPSTAHPNGIFHSEDSKSGAGGQHTHLDPTLVQSPVSRANGSPLSPDSATGAYDQYINQRTLHNQQPIYRDDTAQHMSGQASSTSPATSVVSYGHDSLP
ncbi:hypothetical protein AMS68_004637 [Peltaster fructicola]|uniref:Uncharacterized protein n=1 Tax=Peltaster fructicola TaxID=286661 RepID=A0A6H0XXG5_9PEZI|nr:hypothetical protein AMS68_004637 [Peltaster fructicola]